MIDIEIINYESIDYAKITIDKFTALVGRNHIGKSAILRAINAALSNKQGLNFIKWGKDFCEVKIHIKDKDLKIVWHKEKNNNYYEINGVVYKKIGKDDPPEEIYNAGFKPVVLGDQKISLYYAPQFSPLFLVDNINSKSITLLTTVFELDRLYGAIALCNKEQKENQDILRIREKDLEQLKASVQRYQNLPTVIQKFEQLKKDKENIDKIEEEITKIKLWIDRIKELKTEIKKLEPIHTITIEDRSELKDIIENKEKLSEIYEKFIYLISVVEKLYKITEINIPDFKHIEKEFNDLLKLQEKNKILSILVEEVKRITPYLNINVPQIDVPDIDKLNKIQNYNDIMNNLKVEVNNLKNEIDNIDKEYNSINEEIKSYKICPLCGKAL